MQESPFPILVAEGAEVQFVLRKDGKTISVSGDIIDQEKHKIHNHNMKNSSVNRKINLQIHTHTINAQYELY